MRELPERSGFAVVRRDWDPREFWLPGVLSKAAADREKRYWEQEVFGGPDESDRVIIEVTVCFRVVEGELLEPGVPDGSDSVGPSHEGRARRKSRRDPSG